ncbi:MAG: response regulator [Nevskia sp.]|nr:response regulator [Nevskia sp.]
MTSDPFLPQARILVVDDEVAQMRALCDTLRDHVEEIVGFSSAEAALEAMRDTYFDLLLTDLMMPGMDGITLLRAAQQRDPDLVAIIMTGAGSIGTAVEAMKAGALDYILKPFKLSAILPVLSRALALRNLRLENARLQRSVQERTAELEVANRELQAANRELEAFTHSVSHDLRAPLRSVIGFVEILEDDFSSQWTDEVRELFRHVTGSARRMNDLITDLLHFAQVSRKPLNVRAVDLDDLVREVLEELSPAVGGRRVELRIDGLPPCRGDPSLLRQVFVNLISNAFKYSRNKETALIEVGCRRQENEAVYFVRDNGAGFDMSYAKNLFGVFQRMHREDEFEGTGVGLSIVQRIVQRHGGRIWAQAEPDKGAAFFFTLPPSQAA